MRYIKARFTYLCILVYSLYFTGTIIRLSALAYRMWFCRRVGCLDRARRWSSTFTGVESVGLLAVKWIAGLFVVTSSRCLLLSICRCSQSLGWLLGH